MAKNIQFDDNIDAECVSNLGKKFLTVRVYFSGDDIIPANSSKWCSINMDSIIKEGYTPFSISGYYIPNAQLFVYGIYSNFDFEGGNVQIAIKNMSNESIKILDSHFVNVVYIKN